MEEKAPIKPAMVSRLPKFGVRPTTGVTSPLSNGVTQPATPTQECKTIPPTRPNGVVRASSFSLKWKKDAGSTLTTPAGPDASACPDERGDKPQTPHSPGGRELKRPLMSTPKVARRSASSVSSASSPKPIPRQATMTSPKAEPRQAQRTPLGGVPKPCQNGAVGGSGLVRPRASSSSPCSNSRDSLSQSTDSLKSLTLDNMVRSQSFTHFMQIPSPTSLPMARSFSFNRAVELAKPLANTQLQPPRTNLIKPPQLCNGRLGMSISLGTGIETGLGLGGFQYPRSSSSTCSPFTTPSALKKHPQPNRILSKSSALGHRLTRTGQAKQQKPLFPGKVKAEAMAGMRDRNMSDSPPIPLTPDPVSDRTSEDQVRGTGDGLEDMSLSSASTLSRADTSEEFLDDFDNPGDGDRDVDVSDSKIEGGVATQARLQSFLNETVDWAGMGLSEQKKVMGVGTSFGILNPERGDFLQALELSPSNSSGGTYMWDEEILEPLGPTKHPCESYNESDHLNRMEILNLDNLEDDDLMLDVDLLDDSALLNESNSMAHSERPERGGGQGHWRRRQHRWNGPNPFHNDNRGPVFQQYNGCAGPGAFRVGPRLPPVGRHDGNTGALDELTLKHMAQDCSSVKNKLLKLKSLLQMEEGGPEIVDDNEEENCMTLQLEELMKEVQRLREELRSKERTISQLTQQQLQLQQQVPAQAVQPGRCHCHQRAPSFRGDVRTHHDKATQTPCRGQGHSQPGVLPAPFFSPWQGQYQGPPRTIMPQRRQTSNATAFLPQAPRAPHPGKNSKNSPHRGPQ
ncbi:serine-rich coiled-coil domain-containing protein 2 isoform X2 [Esox lucius]|uniref:Coiled-coil serine-rich protein 2a n=1 Tax=Esox lucius TaxID=8010 RepID=A0A3P8ZK15_ESOLU|nr:serine-rich coiled-coil domain-containing protein 2 isoform X2 [Esox lucius]